MYLSSWLVHESVYNVFYDKTVMEIEHCFHPYIHIFPFPINDGQSWDPFTLLCDNHSRLYGEWQCNRGGNRVGVEKIAIYYDAGLPTFTHVSENIVSGIQKTHWFSFTLKNNKSEKIVRLYISIFVADYVDVV